MIMKTQSRWLKRAGFSLVLGLVLGGVSALGQVTIVQDSIASTLGTNATATANLGAGVQVTRGPVGVEFTFAGSAAGATDGSVTLTIARSADGVTWETTPGIALALTPNGTNTVVGVTNISDAAVGAFNWVKAVKLVNGSTNGSLSGLALRWVFKAQ